MARIPDAELERIKREVSLLRLLESQGHKLIRQGKDWACRCPWHAGDDTPSCVITVKSNLWHCFGCDAGGSVIDWVMRAQRVSFRHACELLFKESPAIDSTPAPRAARAAAAPSTTTTVSSYVRPAADWAEAEDDQRALDEAIALSSPAHPCACPWIFPALSRVLMFALLRTSVPRLTWRMGARVS